MLKFKLTFATGVFCLAAYCAAKAITPPPSIKAIVESNSHLTGLPRVIDFGSVGQLTHRTAHFTLTNRHEEAIRVQAVLKGCGCTTTELKKSELNPGEQVEITAEWSLGRKRGNVEDTILIRYSLADGKSIYSEPLKLRAHVVPDVHVTPEKIVVASNSARKFVVQFSSNSDKPFPDIASHYTNIPNCKVKIDQSGRRATVILPDIEAISLLKNPVVSFTFDTTPFDGVEIPIELP